MDILVSARDWLNKHLETPADQLLAGAVVTVVLSIIASCFPPIRKIAKRCLSTSRDWLKGRLHHWLVKSCTVLGLARQEDLDRLRVEIEEKFRRAGTPAGTDSAQTPSPRTLRRGGCQDRSR